MNAAAGIAGLVLAGGKATRLGGGDKPLREIGGRPMLEHVIERLRAQADPLAISANGDPARFARYGLPVIGDEGPGGQAGPLAGILSGTTWAKSSGRKRLLSVAGDTPFFPADLATRLVDATAERPDHVAVAASGGRRHPVFALWPVGLESELREFLAQSTTFSVAAFLERHGTISVDFPIAEVDGRTMDPFFNVNTPEDLEEAQAIMQCAGL